MTVTPSNDVAENQRVTLLCEFDSNPYVVSFKEISESVPFCQLDATCDSTNCKIGQSPSCPSDTQYSIQVTVPRSWNGESVFCQSAINGEKSNTITFRVTGTVKVNL